MQTQDRNQATETKEDLSGGGHHRDTEKVPVKPVYPRYLVKHQGPNRRDRRDMKFGRRNPNGWVEEK